MGLVSAGDGECDLGQAAVRVAVPGKAVGQDHHVMHRAAMLASDHGSRRERFCAARRDVQFLQCRYTSDGLTLGSLLRDTPQHLEAPAIEIAEGIGLNSICDQPEKKLFGEMLPGGSAGQASTPPRLIETPSIDFLTLENSFDIPRERNGSQRHRLFPVSRKARL